MKRLFLLFVACLSMPCANADTITDARVIDANFFSAVVTLGRGGSGAAPIGACNMGVFVDDGCGSAPAPLTASFARANVFTPGGYANTTAGTSANYMATNCGPSGTSLCRQQFNVAGNADDGYHIGFVTPLGNSSGGVACTTASVASGSCMPTCTKSEATFDGTCLLDPADVAVTGCTYVSGNGVIGNTNPTLGSVPGGGPELDCESAFTGTLQHFNLGPVNGHDCTALRIIPASGVVLLLNDFYFFNNSGLCSTLGTAIDTTQAGAPGALSTVSNFEIDGNWTVFGDTLGNSACVAVNVACNPIDAMNIGFGQPATVEYGAIHNMGYFALGTTQSIMKYDWVEGWCYRAANCHSEWYLGQGSSQHAVFDHITVLGTTVQTQASPSQMLLTANYGTIFDVITYTDNTFINQFSGNIGAPFTTVSGCIGMPPNGGTATSPTCATGSGGIFYQTSATLGVIGQGNSLFPGVCPNTTGGGTSVGGGVYKLIPGPYAVTTPPIQAEFFIDSFAPSPNPGVGGYPAGSLAGGGGTFVLPSASCSGISVNAEQANFANWSNGPGHGPNPVGQLTYTGNLSDFSSGLGSGPYGLLGGTTQSLWDSVSGTASLLVTPISLAGGDIVYSPSLSACTASALSCPTVSSGSGTYPSAGTPTGVSLSSSALFGPAGVTLYVPTSIASGTISGSTLTTGASVTLATGDKIYDVVNGTCSGAAPSTCPTVAAGGTGTSFTLTGVTGTPTAVAMTNLHQAATPTVTINNASPAAIASGNIMLGQTNTTAVHFGSNSYGPFIPTPSCNYPTNNILTCPQVVTPGGNATSYTLSISGGTVGGVNSFVIATAHSPVSCTNVSVLSGNFDMANLISPTTLNTITDSNNSHDQVGC